MTEPCPAGLHVNGATCTCQERIEIEPAYNSDSTAPVPSPVVQGSVSTDQPLYAPAPCPYVRTSPEGTAYCRLAETVPSRAPLSEDLDAIERFVRWAGSAITPATNEEKEAAYGAVQRLRAISAHLPSGAPPPPGGPLPYPENPGQTHYAECWRARGHHNCAVVEIERLRAAPSAARDPEQP